MYPKKIGAVILVAAPFDAENLEESLGDFNLPVSLENFINQVEKTYLLFSKDDSMVSFVQLEKYKKALSNSDTEVKIFENRQHFSQESFPELIDLLKKI